MAAPSARRPCERERVPVCVVIPALDRAAMLPRCLASVWSQRPYLPEEVIVVDDGSQDDTAAVAARLGARVIRHARNLGLAAARNSALEATACEWVAFLDSDDEWLPAHLAHLWHLRDGHSLVGSSVLCCGADGGADRFHGPVKRKPLVLDSPDPLIATYNVFTVSACMIRRELALALGGFRPVWGVEDFDLWVRALEQHSGICSPQVTVIYHVHDEQMSGQAQRMLRGHREVGEGHRARTGASRALLARWEGVAAWDTMRSALAAGQRRAALVRGLAVLGGSQRILGLALLLRSRFIGRRLSARVGRDGKPTVAVLVRDERRRGAVLAALGGRTVRDLSGIAIARALPALARRP
ncbi:MAG: glycosyltransferase, partial [Solirubrobacteraceae bacterium]